MPGHLGHLLIGEHEVEVAALQRVDRFAAVADGGHLVAGPRQVEANHARERDVVFHQQDLCLCRRSWDLRPSRPGQLLVLAQR